LPAVAAVPVETTAELEVAVRERFADNDVLIMAAAPADFRPADPLSEKISREGSEGLSIEFQPTTDIVASVAGERRADQTVIGFAAEHGDGAVERGRAKLDRKGLDAVVVNDISRSDIGFDSTDNEVTIVLPNSEIQVGRRPKAEVAAAILDEVERLRTPASRPLP
jgi:phosphopantothenoylcysteine decarboxylase/phosphopantothenate--cysteine ligase